MLKQLLKYEFKATGRTYGGLYLALVALAVLSGFSLRSSSKDDFASLLLFAYMVVAVAVAVVSVMTIVTRFTRNLLGREGYLMHTLPVTESQLILSKLISSVVWMLCSSIVGIFSFAAMLLALDAAGSVSEQRGPAAAAGAVAESGRDLPRDLPHDRQLRVALADL